VLGDDLFSVIIITIVVSTLIAPPLVRIVANKLKAEEGTIVEEVPA
jgi:NhaP-type Na+/H+ or K+/H+ antiporter